MYHLGLFCGDVLLKRGCTIRRRYLDLLALVVEEPLKLPKLWNILIQPQIKNFHRGFEPFWLHTWIEWNSITLLVGISLSLPPRGRSQHPKTPVELQLMTDLIQKEMVFWDADYCLLLERCHPQTYGYLVHRSCGVTC